MVKEERYCKTTTYSYGTKKLDNESIIQYFCSYCNETIWAHQYDADMVINMDQTYVQFYMVSNYTL